MLVCSCVQERTVCELKNDESEGSKKSDRRPRTRWMHRVEENMRERGEQPVDEEG